jgi:cytochrome bd-type quinol oxidase subunit 2
VNEFIIAQIVCILLPLALFGLIWLTMRCLAERPTRFAFRLDLSTLLCSLAVICVLVFWMKHAPHRANSDFERVMICLLSGMTFPATWFGQLIMDSRRDAQARAKAHAEQIDSADLTGLHPKRRRHKNNRKNSSRGE